MSIVVCVPFIKPHKKFLPHFIQWYACNYEKHKLALHWEMYRPLHKVQAQALAVARDLKASHILFVEDDQWGFPVDGLDVLLEFDKEVVGFPTYTKQPPYLPMTYRKSNKEVSLTSGERNIVPMYATKKLDEFDLITWAFTLVKIDVFDKLKVDPFLSWDIVPTDSHFCQACEDVGIPRYSSNLYTINHGDIPSDEIVFHRRTFDSICASRGIFGKDAIVIEDPHGDIPYRPEFQYAIQIPIVHTANPIPSAPEEVQE